MVSRFLLFLSSGSFGKGNFEDGQKSFLMDGDETFFFGFPNINNFLLADLDDHVKSFDFSANDLSDPEGSVHKLFSSFNGDEVLTFSEEEGKGS